MKNYSILIAIIAAYTQAAFGGMVILPVTDDSTVLEQAPDTNVGGSANPRADDVPGAQREAYFNFDVTNLGDLSGTDILSAVLRLRVTIVDSPGDVEFTQVDSAWTQDTITWNTRPATSTAIAGHSFASGQVGSDVDIDITSLVQGWADGTVTSHGVSMIPVTGGGVAARVASQENPIGMPAQVIVVTQDPPAGGKAYLPKWAPYTNGISGGIAIGATLQLSNVSDEESVDIAISLYRRDGSLVTDDASSTSGLIIDNDAAYQGGTFVSNYNEPTSGATVTFTLEPRENVTIDIGATSINQTHRGHAEISYTFSDGIGSGVALLVDAEVQQYQNGERWTREITVNGGNPF